MWISVKEILPKNSGKYLVWLGGIHGLAFGKTTHIAWWYDGSGCWSFSLNTAIELGKDSSINVKSVDVTHWQPLPEPPKEDE